MNVEKFRTIIETTLRNRVVFNARRGIVLPDDAADRAVAAWEELGKPDDADTVIRLVADFVMSEEKKAGAYGA